MWTFLVVAIVSVAMVGDADGGIEMRLKLVGASEIGAYAEFISVGPAGPAFDDTSDAGIVRIIESASCRLRATLSSCETNAWLNIDEIKTRGSDSRQIMASYRISSFDIWELPRERMPAEVAQLASPSSDAIEWLDAKTFIWHTRYDSVLLERLGEGRFKVSRFVPAR